MITSKQELKYYLECDKKALGINYKRPRMFTDEIWRYQRSLRWLEYRVLYKCRWKKEFYNESDRKVTFS